MTTIEVRPLGDICNIQCSYCYQEGIRAAGNVPRGYDVEAMVRTLDERGDPFMLFGGEAMMARDADLERLFERGLAWHGGSGIQSNGTLIRPHHIEMFRRYLVKVGISIDGPGPLNDVRWAGSLAATRKATARTEAAIERLCREGLTPSIIVTLHRMNAHADRLPIMGEWLAYLDDLGIERVRLHVLQADSGEVREDFSLAPEENLAALRFFRGLEPGFTRLRFDLFGEMADMLRGADEDTSCVWHPCDPYTTRAVKGLEGDGRLTNCGRTNKDGIGYMKSAIAGFERQAALYSTPLDQDGCQGCRFFLMCKGNCPGTGVGSDWRKRSEHCAVWYGLYGDLEAEMLAAGDEPLSLHPQLADLEAELLAQWERGVEESIVSARSRLGIA